jgi:hypothetical protein
MAVIVKEPERVLKRRWKSHGIIKYMLMMLAQNFVSK